MDSLAATLSPLLPFVASFVFLVIFLEQISYLKKKRSVPGPALVLPFVGNTFPLVRNPARFWEIQASLAKSSGLGFSVNYIAGKFIVLTTDTELSHKIFANVRSDAFDLVGHPFGKKLFGKDNMMYMSGQKHKDLRRRIAPNFTPKALSIYTALQQIMILKHLKLWVQKSSESSPKPIPLRFLARDLNLETSQSVFVGPYLDEEDRERFRVDYNIFNVGLMKLPIDLPGTGFRNAKRAAEGLVEVLSDCAKRSKAKMRKEEEPSCLIDFWMQDTVKELADAAEAGQPEPVHTSNYELGLYLFDFLFAAQDASSSSLLWAVSLLDSHPEVVAKVRDEVESIWSPESDSLISSEQLLEMKYTQAVAREVVRYRAPATVVPHVAVANFPLTEFYTIPKGAIVFPSAYESCLQGFAEPDRFDPERFSEDRQEDRIFKRNYLAFGAGSHQCVGQRYALNQLVLFIAMFCTLLDFKRHRSDGCDEIAFNPTICPKDDCMVSMRRRCARFPNLSLNN